MKFEVDDPALLLNQASSLETSANKIKQVSLEIENTVNGVAENWTSDTEDRDSYLSDIQVDLNELDNLYKVLKSLAKEMTDFANETIKAANNDETETL